jgi:diadenosine tetraphosphatase ApaH/serine/threonine PP2A family protein phosphatase
MVHSNLGDYIWNNLYPDDEFNLAEQLQPLEKRVGRDTTAVWLLVGHTHMVTVARLEGPTSLHYLPITYGTPISVAQGVFLLNPGSVGQPRDGDPRASYALLDLGKGTITFHRVTYDTSAVQIEMQEHGYPATLIELLDSARIRATLNFDRVYKREGSQGILPRSGYR